MPQFPKEVIFLEEIKRVVFSRRRLVALLLLAALCLVNLVRISPRRNTGISQVKTEQFLKAHQGESLEELQTQLDRILPPVRLRPSGCWLLMRLYRRKSAACPGLRPRRPVMKKVPPMSTLPFLTASPWRCAMVIWKRCSCKPFTEPLQLPCNLPAFRAVFLIQGRRSAAA